MANIQQYPSKTSNGIPITVFEISMGVAPSFAQFPPPSDFLPSAMTYTYLCDYQDEWKCLNDLIAYRQPTNSSSPLSGMGMYIKKGIEPEASIFIGVATLAQANASPMNPAGWTISIEYLASSFATNEMKWVGFFFDSSDHYISQEQLYLMVYTPSNLGCDPGYPGWGWYAGFTPSTTQCQKADFNQYQSWSQIQKGMTAVRMGPIGLQCGDYHDSMTCGANGCHWYCNGCNEGTPGNCDMLNCNKTDCENYGCHWWNGTCHTNPPVICSECNNQTDCVNYNCYWYGGACYPTAGVTCWRCNGETAESMDFPPGTICGQGNASDYPEVSSPNCATSCHNPERREGKLACINGFVYQCNGGSWQTTGEPCLNDCAFQGTETECVNNGCFWYSYPNPFGEKSCQPKTWVEAFMPYIIAGTGVAAIAISLLSLRMPSQNYYPQQPYYPQPRQYASGKTTRRKK